MGETDPGALVRMAELLAALSLGIDLGFGQPMEHVLRQCRIALRICELAGLDEADRAAVYYTALLVNVGCHTDAHEQAHWCGDDIAMKATKYQYEPSSVAEIGAMLRLLGSGGTPLHRVRVAFDFAWSGRKGVDGMIAGHSRMARALGEQVGLPDTVLDALAGSYERWDGKGFPGDLAGTDIPVASRIAQLAEFLEWPTVPAGSAPPSTWPSGVRASSSTQRSWRCSPPTSRRCSTASTNSGHGTRSSMGNRP